MADDVMQDEARSADQPPEGDALIEPPVSAVAPPLALYRRYRPDSFADVIGQEHVTEPLQRALVNNRVNHAYLFSGPRGCGKTTSARILARALNCEQGPAAEPCGQCPPCRDLATNGPGSIDVIEIDAASHGGVDDARDLRERAFFAPVSSRYKIYIVDEAHMVTTAGFNALLKLVEEPPPHVKFIFATTEPDKVIGTIRSRTHHYPFRLVPPRVLSDYLARLCAAEGIETENGVLPLVVRAGAGSVRDSLSVLDQLLGGAEASGVSYRHAAALLGYTPDSLLDEMLDAFAAGDAGGVFRCVDKVIEVGQDPRRFAEDLLRRLRDLVIVAAVPDALTSGLVEVADDQAERFSSQAASLGAGELTRAGEVIAAGLTEMRGTTAPRLHLELMCARVLLPGTDLDDRGVHARLDRLERRIGMTGTGDRPSPEPADRPSPEPVEGRPEPADRPSPAPVEGRPDAGVPPSPEPAAATRPEPAAATSPEPVEGRPDPGEAAAVPDALRQAQGAGGAAQGAGGAAQGAGGAAQGAGGAAQGAGGAAQGAGGAAQGAGDAAEGAGDAGAEEWPEPAQPGGQQPQPPAESSEAAAAGAAPSPPGQAPVDSRPGATSLTITDIRRLWPDILEAVKNRRRFTWILLSQNASVADLTGGTLVLAMPNAGARDSFARGGSEDILAEALIAVLGAELRIETVVDPSAGGSGGRGRAGGPGPSDGPGYGGFGTGGSDPGGAPGTGQGSAPAPVPEQGWNGGGGAPPGASGAPGSSPASASDTTAPNAPGPTGGGPTLGASSMPRNQPPGAGGPANSDPSAGGGPTTATAAAPAQMASTGPPPWAVEAPDQDAAAASSEPNGGYGPAGPGPGHPTAGSGWDDPDALVDASDAVLDETGESHTELLQRRLGAEVIAEDESGA